MRAVAVVGFSDRGILRDTLLLTLAKTQDEKQALGECFDLFFDQPEPTPPKPEDGGDGSPRLRNKGSESGARRNPRQEARRRRAPKALARWRRC